MSESLQLRLCNTGYELTGSDTRTCQSDESGVVLRLLVQEVTMYVYMYHCFKNT